MEDVGAARQVKGWRVNVRCLRGHGGQGCSSKTVSDINIVPLPAYRELPSLAKNWVMRMLFLEQPLPQAAVALWVKKEFSKSVSCIFS